MQLVWYFLAKAGMACAGAARRSRANVSRAAGTQALLEQQFMSLSPRVIARALKQEACQGPARPGCPAVRAAGARWAGAVHVQDLPGWMGRIAGFARSAGAHWYDGPWRTP